MIPDEKTNEELLNELRDAGADAEASTHIPSQRRFFAAFNAMLARAERDARAQLEAQATVDAAVANVDAAIAKANGEQR